MNACDIIYKKRQGKPLTEEEIRFFVDGYAKGDIPDYQASALMMAICCRDMDDAETAVLTDAMAHSGMISDLSRFGDVSVDKHSTGGVGDKTTLVVAPTVACLGAKIAKMSGRGLGHTGGTVDKLESIPGYRSELDADAFLRQVEEIGVAVIGQSEMFTPADKKLYALRDVTATVDSIPLIASSIMSKKLASGARSIVLDVKVGIGAFMKDEKSARQLAYRMVEIGKRHGRNMAALMTNMDAPLGNTVGNSLEMIEAIEILQGKRKGPVYDVAIKLIGQMASFALKIPVAEAQKRAIRAIESGSAFSKMKEWITAQGGDGRYLEDTSLFPVARACETICASEDGFIAQIDAVKIGMACMSLGAGRFKKGDVIDHTAGITLAKTMGDPVCKGEPLCSLFTDRPERLDAAKKMAIQAFCITERPPEKKPLIYKIIR